MASNQNGLRNTGGVVVGDVPWGTHFSYLSKAGGGFRPDAAAKRVCDELMEELQHRTGLAGEVCRILLPNLMQQTSSGEVAKQSHMAARTLRRKLREENTSFRNLVNELRAQVAIKYLRDTNLTVEEIAYALGFSDAANFRHAFRRWTKRAPQEFRDILKVTA